MSSQAVKCAALQNSNFHSTIGWPLWLSEQVNSFLFCEKYCLGEYRSNLCVCGPTIRCCSKVATLYNLHFRHTFVEFSCLRDSHAGRPLVFLWVFCFVLLSMFNDLMFPLVSVVHTNRMAEVDDERAKSCSHLDRYWLIVGDKQFVVKGWVQWELLEWKRSHGLGRRGHQVLLICIFHQKINFRITAKAQLWHFS